MSRRSSNAHITASMAFEIWWWDVDHAFVLRLRGDIVTGYYPGPRRITDYWSLPTSIFELSQLDFLEDEEGCSEWEKIRSGEVEDAPDLQERFPPEVVVEALANRPEDYRSLMLLGVLAAPVVVLLLGAPGSVAVFAMLAVGAVYWLRYG